MENPSQPLRGDPERSEGPHSGEINAQHRDASHRINTEVQNVATQSSLSSLANVNQRVIGSPPPEVVASGVTQDKSSASDDKVRKSRKRFIESDYVGLSRVPRFPSPLPTRKIELYMLMSTSSYRPRNQR